MSSEVLKKHYEEKYSHEADELSIEPVARRAAPRDRCEAVITYLPGRFKGGKILEIGAGNGNVAKTLLESELPIESYSLGDISLPRIEGIRNHLKDERLEVSLMDAEKIDDAERGKYDAILMVALIEHLIDPLGAMCNIRQLLKPEGFVYIDTPNIAKFTRRLLLALGRFPSTASTNEGLTTYWGKPVELHEEGHLHYFTYRSLSLMLTERCGFSRVEKIGYAAGRTPLGHRVHHHLAGMWPEMFSELALFAYA